MATKVHMEALSPTMEEGQLVRWLKKEGDAVSEGDVLAEIETDKATMELVARGSGVLQNVALKEGDTAPVGQVIAFIGAEGETVEGEEPVAAEPGSDREQPADAEAQATPAAEGTGARDSARGAEPKEARSGAGREKGRDEARPEAGREKGRDEARPEAGREKGRDEARSEAGRDKQRDDARPEVGRDKQRDEARAEAGREERREVREAAREERRPAEARGDGAEARVKASPLARRLAAESGVELAEVEGTGPGGRITKRDIEAALEAGAGAGAGRKAAGEAAAEAEAGAPVAAAGPAPRVAAGPDSEEMPVSQMRKAIAKRLVQSIGPIPTFYLTIEVDMTRMMELREQVNRRLEEDGVKASINDFLIKAVAVALSRHPEVNASWGDQAIVRHHRVHVGVAVAIEDGLITPIVRDADRKRVREIATAVKELAGRAREKKLKPEEYTGATFSVSNLGMFGIVEFTAIINPPEGGILAVGAVEEKAIVVDGAVVVQPRMRMTMSCDHRVVDGATGAKFLQTVRELIEDPMMMLA
jgi:pyruvate dehydrogenase E2 component (dihydrolipoamide acetyltransferase)